ncbi:MAG: 2-phosphosulfolactate phosphatase [Chloroflexi bacterium HGW-Chloroflexi-10]|nr:MAG: 2-phosphosulfolactate phosphatase [Chloroflexi bacterium HGW-Chloroflexi-10]
MRFFHTNLENCQNTVRNHPEAVVIVIDVLRAFTTAAHVLAAGAPEIILVSTINEAFAWREQNPRLLLLGEVGGIPAEGFDLGNSPSRVPAQITQTVVQRTSAGTQGVVLAARAAAESGSVPPILCVSLPNISATMRAVQTCAADTVLFIETGVRPDNWGGEDIACADALESLLQEQPVDWPAITARVLDPRSSVLFDGSHPAFPSADLDCATDIDRFDFAMQVHILPDRLALRKS